MSAGVITPGELGVQVPGRTASRTNFLKPVRKVWRAAKTVGRGAGTFVDWNPQSIKGWLKEFYQYIRDDLQRVAKAAMGSDMASFFTPVAGGFSSLMDEPKPDKVDPNTAAMQDAAASMKESAAVSKAAAQTRIPSKPGVTSTDVSLMEGIESSEDIGR